ncbi:MAG: ATP-binding cassette domain-containing protein [Gammaproteobacteria bacterium]|nr:MAG: ATP-binding cassette domain-containing protein [Gammaproteobacteria bacterium]
MGKTGNGIEIRVEGLHKAFGDNRVLRGIDLTIRQGDLLAIVGGSGCGKTVLLNHILGLLTPDAGRVLVVDYGSEGHPLRDLAECSTEDLDRIHSFWGMVFQRNALFSGTVYDNIALGLSEVKGMTDEEIRPIAREVLEAVALPSDDAFLALSVEQLSGGMAKRLAVARAIAMAPRVIFYDEPTTGLDPVSSAQIHELIYKTHHQPRQGVDHVTSLIITHDKDLLARLQPRVVMLYEGKVCFDGSYEDFRTSDSPVIRPYFEQMPVLHGRTGG